MAKVLNANDFIKKGLENLREMKGHVSHSTVEEHLELLKNTIGTRVPGIVEAIKRNDPKEIDAMLGELHALDLKENSPHIDRNLIDETNRHLREYVHKIRDVFHSRPKGSAAKNRVLSTEKFVVPSYADEHPGVVAGIAGAGMLLGASPFIMHAYNKYSRAKQKALESKS